jgi:hypothetical protein
MNFLNFPFVKVGKEGITDFYYSSVMERREIMGSVVKKRRKKMRKHKHKKQLDRDRHKKKK